MKALQFWHQPPRGDGWNDGNREIRPFVPLADLSASLSQLRKRVVDSTSKHDGILAGRYAATIPLKQGSSEPAFKSLYVVTDRGMGDVEFFRRLRDTLQPCDRCQRAKGDKWRNSGRIHLSDFLTNVFDLSALFHVCSLSNGRVEKQATAAKE
ncbi:MULTISPECIES: hypothetical protein [unclassified Rhizobium]|uniref:hypothetical protein n=1 Tax=unclassified Rhizobium TaxID=2613769 RepID=UPI001FDFA630|nr:MULTISPECIES: hypothetical protein [unclassified Rhizobium]